MSGRFAAAMRLMRKHDPQLQEDGFHDLALIAHDHVPELMAEFAAEKDHGLRCWLLELIGMAKSPAAMGLLVEHLDSDDESLRDWAIRGLRLLDTRESRRILWERDAAAGGGEVGMG